MKEEHITLTLDDDPVRFTPDGKIAVIDAIKSLSESHCPTCIWEDLIEENPGLLEYCHDYQFQKNRSDPVVDSEGWDIIQMLLIDYLIEQNV